MTDTYCLFCGGNETHAKWCDLYTPAVTYRHTTPRRPGPAAHQARRTDPATSHQAAAAITAERLTKIQQLVVDQLRTHGPMTDEQLLQSIAVDTGRDFAPSTIKTRRSELVAAGVVVDTLEIRQTRFGRNAIVWALA
jgi:hypothetical protein